MMVRTVLAYILISTVPKASYEVRDRLLELDNVREAHVVFGHYDVIAKIEVPDSERLGFIVFNEIRSMEDVINTATVTVIP